MNAPATGTNAGPTKGGPERRTKGGYHPRNTIIARPATNVKRTSHHECTKPNDKASAKVYKTGPPTHHTQQYSGHRSTNHAGNPKTPNPTRYRGHAGKTISPTGKDCPAPEESPQGQVCPHCRTFTKPQHNQSAGNKFAYQRGMEQLATALHPNKSPPEGRTYRC